MDLAHAADRHGGGRPFREGPVDGFLEAVLNDVSNAMARQPGGRGLQGPKNDATTRGLRRHITDHLAQFDRGPLSSQLLGQELARPQEGFVSPTLAPGRAEVSPVPMVEKPGPGETNPHVEKSSESRPAVERGRGQGATAPRRFSRRALSVNGTKIGPPIGAIDDGERPQPGLQ